jgi:ribosome-binding protein aMBF1 (putative translation factor)
MEVGDFSMNLKTARQKAGLAQWQLARYLGCAQTLVHFWESGTQVPSAGYREKMDRLFGNQVDWVAEFEPLDEHKKMLH